MSSTRMLQDFRIMNQVNGKENSHRVYKIVLTGGPCGGKTTGQARLSTFFETLGWKVFRVPETASVLLGGGIKFSDLSPEEAISFQENLLKTMLQIENTFFSLGESSSQDCLIICDRGAMDASAFVLKDKWEKIIANNNWNNVELRDNRYNQIIHMVSAANGAEEFYSTEDHSCRSEGVELARELDYRAAASWVGHPYFDVIDNSTDFETKMNRMIDSVCQKLGIDTGDRLLKNSKKHKFLVRGPLPPDEVFPPFQDFDVVHNYLQTSSANFQARLRKRGQKGHWMYFHTLRKPKIKDQVALSWAPLHTNKENSDNNNKHNKKNVKKDSRVKDGNKVRVIEVRTQLTHRDYLNILAQRDDSHFTIYKKRRCFLVNNQYFQLDIYKEPGHPRCKGLLLLETYSALDESELAQRLPSFLNIVKEVTGNPRYSMFNLSLKEDWNSSSRFCYHLADKKVNGYGPPEISPEVRKNGDSTEI